jgi:quercetin dioxygenase-like cupin family protein
MTQPIANPGEKIEVRPLQLEAEARQVEILAKTNNVEIVRLVIPATGGDVPTYAAQGEIILHCLEGRVLLTTRGDTHELKAGQLLYLLTDEQFSVQGLKNALLLMYVVTPKQGASVEVIGDLFHPQ